MLVEVNPEHCIALLLTCGHILLESGGLARILPPQLPWLRGGLNTRPGPPSILGGGGRGGLQGVSRGCGSGVGRVTAEMVQAWVTVLSGHQM